MASTVEAKSAAAPVGGSTASGIKSDASQNDQVQAQDCTTVEQKDIRKHPKYSFLYEVRQYNTLYHVVERLGSQKHKNKSFIKKFKIAYRDMKRKAPILARFTMELLPVLGKKRIALYLLGDMTTESIIPIIRTNATYELAVLTIEAIRTRSMDWLAVSKVILSDIGVYLLEQSIERRLNENKAKLAYRYSSYLRERLMKARVDLDSVTLANAKVQDHFQTANRLLTTSWSNAFILTRLSSVFTDVTNLLHATMLIYKITSTHKSPLATWSFILHVTFVVRRWINYLRSGHGKRVTAITDENYRRSESMYEASEKMDAQDQILGLQSYYFDEFKRAQEAVGDANADRPDTWDDDLQHPWRTLLYETSEKLNGSLMYLLLALNAIKNPTASLIDASTVINDLSAIQTATWDFSYGIYRLFRDSQSFTENLTPIETYYTLSQLKPLLRRDQNPLQYNPTTASSSGSSVSAVTEPLSSNEPTLPDNSHVVVRGDSVADPSPSNNYGKHGMEIEFVSVSYTYPNKFKKALNNVSFKIEAGQLCSVVGFSGSGKSTLIALLVRLHDPDEGKILINGVDIKRYDLQDLYRHISFLFQKTEKPTFTIKEFIRLGRLNATDDEIDQAAKDSGADQIISKFKRGLDTELSARHYYDTAVTVEMLVTRAQHYDESDIKWRNQSAPGKLDDDDDEEDPRTDAELLATLTNTLTSNLSVEAIDNLSMWTLLGAREELPDPLEDEETVLEEGYDAKKAEEEEKKNQVDTAHFSGGEWSKIVLARSFLRDSAHLVILDEFSAALDPLSEASIFEKFMKRRGERTIIAVTHRFHLAYRSDLILFLQDGELKEKGRHHDLMKMDGRYKEMYLKTTNVSGKEVACQTVAEGEEHIPVSLTAKEKEETASAEGVASI